MARFQKGQTSQSVILKKQMITKSMFRKAEILDEIMEYNELPANLLSNRLVVTLEKVNQWSDASLDVINYSYNSTRAEHNKLALGQLSVAIKKLNKRLKQSEPSDDPKQGTTKSRLTTEDVVKLKRENEDLKSALAEVYRAYMQLLDSCREDEQIDKAYRKLILDQARILGNNRLALIK